MSLRVIIVASLTFSVILPAEQPPALDVSRLAWMAGCWEQRSGGTITQESWMAPEGGAMVGMSRTVAGGAMRAWEALRIVSDSGRLVYVAQPNGRSTTAFPALLTSDTLAVFENLAHDFPQRVTYRRLSADSIVARISAERDGKSRGMDIRMRRMSCG